MPMTIHPPRPDELGCVVTDLDVDQLTEDDAEQLRRTIYDHRLIVIKDQGDISPSQFVRLGRLLGRVVPYYEPMYHHPEEPDIFVSSTLAAESGRRVGVPRTGKFWHSDYQFTPEPFAFTVFSPKILPEGNRGTFFIDMARAFEALDEDLRRRARRATATHSVRRYFKIRPDDVYRPLGEIIDEVEATSPPTTRNAVIVHPVSGEEILYISEGFTVSVDGGGPGLREELLAACGQLDPTFTHPAIVTHSYEPGEIVIWDNRALCHRALHVVDGGGDSVSHRLTVVDDLPFDARA